MLPLLKYLRETALFCIGGGLMLAVILAIPVYESNLASLLIHFCVGTLVYVIAVSPFLYVKAIKKLRE